MVLSLVQIVPFWLMRALTWLLGPFDTPLSSRFSLSTSSLFGTVRCSRVTLCVSAPVLESATRVRLILHLLTVCLVGVVLVVTNSFI